MKKSKVKNALASAYLVFSLITVGFIVFFVFEYVIDESTVEADSVWTQTSDKDFNNGTLNNITIEGNGAEAELKIDLSELQLARLIVGIHYVHGEFQL